MASENDAFSAALNQQLEELEAEKAKIEAKIKAVRLLLELEDAEESGDQEASVKSPSKPAANGKILSDSFHRLTAPDAVLKYLKMVGPPTRPMNEILASLKYGGLKGSEKEPDKFYNGVYTALTRLQKRDGKVEKTNSGTWGLVEWYSK